MQDGRVDLRADCSRCFGLCCVALPFGASADFAIDKAAGEPCPHLEADHRCGIHDRLRDVGFRGCGVFDCFGAGQKVSQETFGGRSWRDDPGIARQMFEVFPVMRQLHEVLWYLVEALSLPGASTVRADLERLRGDVEDATHDDPGSLAARDVAAFRARARPLLTRVSDLVRAEAPGPRTDRSGADLVGARLRGADLRGANLRGTLLLAADLRGADLRVADLLGADLRDADLSGADLTGALFLTQPQVDGAMGDATTWLPARSDRPRHWEPAQGS
jgi:uncharacterized protein YjbI with pentapeptide repeats